MFWSITKEQLFVMNHKLVWKRQVLSNGLTILLYPRKSLTAQLSLMIKYGSIDDEAEKIGAAHFLEHMLVSGSQKRIKLQHQIEELGGCSSFETTNDSTFVSLDIFSEKLIQASEIMTKLVFDQTFEQEKLVLERKVILNEIAEAFDDPRDRTAQALIKNLFPSHPIRHPILGTKKTINELTLEDIKKTHSCQYTPSNMVLILTGNVTKADIDSIVLKFNEKSEEKKPIKSQRQTEKCKPRKELIIRKSGVGQAYLDFGLRTPPALSPETIPLDLINSILGIGESSRLFVQLREKTALTYDIESTNLSGLDYGYFSIACAVRTNRIMQTLKAIKKELEKITNNQVQQEEIEKSKNLMIGDIIRGIDSPHELPRIMADVELIYGDERGLSNYIDKLILVNKQSIKDIACKYFQEEKYSTAILTAK